MSKEIKEILDELESLFEISEAPEHIINGFNKLKDYITNLQQKVEQLEKIRKEAIEYIEKNLTIGCILDGKKTYCLNSYSFDYQNLLNILNKGSDKE